jgi:glycosyltransferase involved in cell wall biosynthesis
MEYLGTNKPVNQIQPIVSVCITTYNHEPYIAECLESVLMQQTNFPFEIIIGEDESTDNTREICKGYAEKYPDKIRLFLRSEKDKIYVNGIKTGRYNFIENLKVASGKYIALCDGDDYWTDSYKLTKQYNYFLNHNECVLNHHHYCKLIHGAKMNIDVVPLKYISDTADMLERWDIRLSTVMFLNILPLFVIPDWVYKNQVGDRALFTWLSLFGYTYFIEDTMAVYRLDKPDSMIHAIRDVYFLGKLQFYEKIREHHAFQCYRRIINEQIVRVSEAAILKSISKEDMDKIIEFRNAKKLAQSELSGCSVKHSWKILKFNIKYYKIKFKYLFSIKYYG